MLKRGYLASSSVYVSMKLSSKIVQDYLEHVDEVFKIISNAIQQNTLNNLLKTSIRSDSFKD